MRNSLVELRDLGETLLVILVTWLLLGWFFDRAITQADGTVFVVPYMRSALAGGFDWTHHLYRFGVVGGSAMHDFNGTLPIAQLAALLGLSTTLAVDVVTIFVQLCLGFFGLVAVRALVATWTGDDRALGRPQRIACIWLTAFAPIAAWRLAYGHEILLLGLVPMLAGLALLWASRARTLGNVALAFAAFAVWNAVSCLGQQTMIYSVVFAAPVAIVALLDAPPGERWGWPQWRVVLALAAGVLVACPRLAGMIQHATGDDASRSLSTSLVYAFPSPSATDWLTSLTWAGGAAGDLHERNFPLGPLVAFAILLWPTGRARRLLWAFAAGLALAILFAADVPPISTALVHLPLIDAFRVPARAVLPLLVLVPVIAIATWLAWPSVRAPVPARPWSLALAGALAIVVVGDALPAALREPIAWLACVGLATAARWRPARFAQHRGAVGLAIVAALGVVAFGERFPKRAAFDAIEDGPAAIRRAVLRQAPELAGALDRVQIVDAPPPYAMSTAWAAGLSSLDGDMIPPRRFFALVAALTGVPVPPTTVVWQLTRSRAFPVLQQLYNVRYVVELPSRATAGSIAPQPPTPGAAWFPAQLELAPDAAAVAAALAARGDLHATLVHTAWLVRTDPDIPAATTCSGARVGHVTTDDVGQTATIETDVTAPGCVLVVATNYVSTLRATAGEAALPVFPIDVALTGIAVPPGHATIVLSPEPIVPGWSRVASLLGVLALALALLAGAHGRRRR